MNEDCSLCFVDFWPQFNPSDNFFYHLLTRNLPDCQISFDYYHPDLLFFSCFGDSHVSYAGKTCKRIFYCGENFRPNLERSDLALTFDRLDDPRHLRLPLWQLYVDWFGQGDLGGRQPAYLIAPQDLVKGLDYVARQAPETRRFCGFVYRRDAAERSRFFNRLAAYRSVDSAGPLFNNVGHVLGGHEGDKIDWLRGYKFTICYENSSHPGYLTEKILHAMAAGSIPIYWGDREAHTDFNPKSFLSRHDYGSDEELIEEIVRLDNDEEAYRAMLREPWFEDNQPRLDERGIVAALLPEKPLRRRRLPRATPMHHHVSRVDHAFVINLDRRQDRLRSFRDGCPLPGELVERWSAVDGRMLEPTRETLEVFAGNDFEYRRGVMGCALSHYNLWRHIASESHPYDVNLVFEDDAIFPDYFPALWNERIADLLPAELDLVYFGGIPLPSEAAQIMAERGGYVHVDPSCYVRARVNGHLGIPSDRPFGLGTYAYLVTKSGATALCRAVMSQGIRRAIDYFIIEQWPELRVYATVPFLCLSILEHDSNVQDDAGGLS